MDRSLEPQGAGARLAGTDCGVANLQTEQDMEAAMENLYLNVWSQDEQGVLAAAQKLTALLGQLAE